MPAYHAFPQEFQIFIFPSVCSSYTNLHMFVILSMENLFIDPVFHRI